MASSVRRQFGESVASIGRYNMPISQATTPSLDALKAFSLGDLARSRGDDADAVEPFETVDARTWAAHRVAKVQREIAVTEYEKAIQGAFRDVADALAYAHEHGVVHRERVDARHHAVEAKAPAVVGVDDGAPGHRYAGVAERLVRWRWAVVAAFVVVSGVAIALIGGRLGTEIFPRVETGQLQVRLRAPAGTQLEGTEERWRCGRWNSCRAELKK